MIGNASAGSGARELPGVRPPIHGAERGPVAHGRSMPCLTVIQPWATLIAAGAKRVETRDWIREDLCGRRVAIHAAARWSPRQHMFAAGTPRIADALRAAGFMPSADDGQAPWLPLGAVVATVRIVGFAEYASLDAWTWTRVASAAMGDQDHGRFAWLLEDPRPFPEPHPAAGQRGLWRWPVHQGAGPPD